MFALVVVAFASLEGGAAELRVEPPGEFEDDSVRGEGEAIGPSQITVILTSDAAVP